MIRLEGEKRWRRLMVWQFSNIGTLFVHIDGKPHVVRSEMLPAEGAASGALPTTLDSCRPGPPGRAGSGGVRRYPGRTA